MFKGGLYSQLVYIIQAFSIRIADLTDKTLIFNFSLINLSFFLNDLVYSIMNA